MMYFAIILCSLALASADVSHLFNHESPDHYQAPAEQDHSGYNYPKPSVAFSLPNNEYLPPPTAAATYLPPEVRTTDEAPATPAPTYLAPSNDYLPPTDKPIFRIPIPSYAAPLEYDYAPEEPANEYLPPVSEPLPAEPKPEVQHTGYHYNVPSIPFRF